MSTPLIWPFSSTNSNGGYVASVPMMSLSLREQAQSSESREKVFQGEKTEHNPTNF
jgi:hypothetical protein